MYTSMILLSLSFLSWSNLAVFENERSIIVSKDGSLFKLPNAPELESVDRFEITFTPPPEDKKNHDREQRDEDSKKRNSPANDLSVEQLILRAKKAFKQKKYEDSLLYLDKADETDSKNFRVKKMKGSVYYLLGWKDYAKRYYQESLDLKPEQPEIKDMLLKIEKEP